MHDRLHDKGTQQIANDIVQLRSRMLHFALPRS
jgi:hypothetical protein